MVEIKELSFNESEKLMNKFKCLENDYLSTNWIGSDDQNAKYIWLLADIEKPLGFLSYKVLIHPNNIDFIYIVKIYALKKYRGKTPILIENEKVSEILFRQIDRKGVDILTLESACNKLLMLRQN